MQTITPSSLPPSLSPSPSIPTLSSSLFPNYTHINHTLLPPNIATQLLQLRKELLDGELTERGFLKRQATLLQPYRHLVSVPDTPRSRMGGKREKREGERGKGGGGRGGGGGGGGVRQHVELINGGERKLMAVSRKLMAVSL